MIPVISSPTRSWYSSYIIFRSASRIRCRITCLAVWAAIRPKSSGVTSRDCDLVLVGSEDLGIELGLLGLAELARLGIDCRLLLLGHLGEQLLLELGRQDQLEDAEVGGVAVEVDARVLGGTGALLVGGQQRVLERRHQRLGVDALLLLEAVKGLDDLAAQALPPPKSGTRFERRMPASGMPDRRRRRRRARRSRRRPPVSVPVKLLLPVDRLVGAHLDPAPEEAPEVLRLGQRPVEARARRPRASRTRAGRGARPSPARRARGRPRPGWSM